MRWFAVQVTSRHEKKVKNYLEKRKADGLAGRVGRIIIPGSLPGYVFIEADLWPECYLSGLTTRHRVIGTIEEFQIDAMMQAAEDTPFKEGERVEILAGPLAGLAGTVKQPGRERSRVEVRFFKEEVRVYVENQMLRPVSEEGGEEG